jgi:uncharacterized protein (DUF1778 family)
MGARAKKKESTNLKEEKLHIRVNQKDKNLIEKAADFLGLNASAFVLENALKAARRELASVETLSLSRKDAEVFLRLLTDPPTSNKEMKDAFTDYNSRVVNKN